MVKGRRVRTWVARICARAWSVKAMRSALKVSAAPMIAFGWDAQMANAAVRTAVRTTHASTRNVVLRVSAETASVSLAAPKFRVQRPKHVSMVSASQLDVQIASGVQKKVKYVSTMRVCQTLAPKRAAGRLRSV